MTLFLHSVIFATALTAAGLASAAAYHSINDAASSKSDRLQWPSDRMPGDYVTVEQRGAGVSVLTRVVAP